MSIKKKKKKEEENMKSLEWPATEQRE